MWKESGLCKAKNVAIDKAYIAVSDYEIMRDEMKSDAVQHTVNCFYALSQSLPKLRCIVSSSLKCYPSLCAKNLLSLKPV